MRIGNTYARCEGSRQMPSNHRGECFFAIAARRPRGERLGELQARMMRLDGLGEHLAKVAGLKPQELPSWQSGQDPGRGGAESLLPSKALSVDEFSDLLAKLGRQLEERSDQLGVLEALL